MLIDCDDCSARATAACGDCVVTALLDRPRPLVVDAPERAALGELARAGLAPVLRFTPAARAS